MPEMRISPRERLVLTAIIELYIAIRRAGSFAGGCALF